MSSITIDSSNTRLLFILAGCYAFYTFFRKVRFMPGALSVLICVFGLFATHEDLPLLMLFYITDLVCIDSWSFIYVRVFLISIALMRSKLLLAVDLLPRPIFNWLFFKMSIIILLCFSSRGLSWAPLERPFREWSKFLVLIFLF